MDAGYRSPLAALGQQAQLSAVLKGVPSDHHFVHQQLCPCVGVKRPGSSVGRLHHRLVAATQECVARAP